MASLKLFANLVWHEKLWLLFVPLGGRVAAAVVGGRRCCWLDRRHDRRHERRHGRRRTKQKGRPCYCLQSITGPRRQEVAHLGPSAWRNPNLFVRLTCLACHVVWRVQSATLAAGCRSVCLFARPETTTSDKIDLRAAPRSQLGRPNWQPEGFKVGG